MATSPRRSTHPVHVSALRHVLDGDLDGIERAGPWAFSAAWREALEADLRAAGSSGPTPSIPGVPLPSEPWATEVTAQLPFERRGAKLYLPGAVATLGGKETEAEALEATLAAAGVAATKVDDADLARFLEREGRLVRLGDGYAIGAAGYEVARDVLVTECRAAGEITLARFRDLVGTGRRDAQLLLERFDQDGDHAAGRRQARVAASGARVRHIRRGEASLAPTGRVGHRCAAPIQARAPSPRLRRHG